MNNRQGDGKAHLHQQLSVASTLPAIKLAIGALACLSLMLGNAAYGQTMTAAATSPAGASGGTQSCGEATGPTSCGASGPASKNDKTVDEGGGNPINVITGNKYQREVDLPALPGVLGLELVRHYNSQFSGVGFPNGIMGRGWKLSYETELHVVGRALQIVQADGARLIFNRDLLNPSDCGTSRVSDGRITIRRGPRGDEYMWTWPNGRRLSFDHRGKLVQIAAPTGEFLTLQHDARGHLVQVTDPQGRQLKLNYAEPARGKAQPERFTGVQSIDTPVGRYVYEYGSTPPKDTQVDKIQLAANLVKVHLPTHYEPDKPAHPLTSRGTTSSSISRAYHYEDARFPTLLTGISVSGSGSDGKPLNQRISTYGYDQRAWAVRSEHGGQKVELALLERASLSEMPGSTPGRSVLVHGRTAAQPEGRRLEIRSAMVAGDYRITETRGEPCVAALPCPRANMRYRYDAKGRLTEEIQLDQQGRALMGVRTAYDPMDRVVRVSQLTYKEGKPGAARWMVRYDYGTTGERPTLIAKPSVVPGREHQIWLSYNDRGQTTKLLEKGWRPAVLDMLEEPIQRSTIYQYAIVNGRSLLKTVDGPLPGNADMVSLQWDKRGDNLLQANYPAGITHQITRDQAGRISSVDLSDGFRIIKTAWSYAMPDRVEKVSHGARISTDANAPKTLITLASYKYDISGHITNFETTYGQHQIERNSAGDLISLTDAKGQKILTLPSQESRLIAWIAQNAKGQVLDGQWNLHLENQKIALSLSATPSNDFPIEAQFSVNSPASNPDSPASDRTAYQISNQGIRYKNEAGQQHLMLSDDFGRTVFDSSPVEGEIVYTFGENSSGSWQLKEHHDLKREKKISERLEFDIAGRPIRRIRGTCSESLAYEGQLVRELIGCNDRTIYTRDSWGRIISQTKHVVDLDITERFQYDDIGTLIKRELFDGEVLYYQREKTSAEIVAVARDRQWIRWVRNKTSRLIAERLVNLLPNKITRMDILKDRRVRFWDGQTTNWRTTSGQLESRQYTKNGRISEIRLRTSTGKSQALLKYQYGNSNLTRSLFSSKGEESLSQAKSQTFFQYDKNAELEGEFNRVQFNALKASTRTTAQTVEHSSPPHLDNFGRQTEHISWSTNRKVRQNFVYNDIGQLSEVWAENKILAKYKYDAHGNRIKKTVFQNKNTLVTRYLYDNQRRLAAEILFDGKIKHYLYMGHSPYAMIENGEIYAIHTDARGLPFAVSNANQELVWDVQFDAYGNYQTETSQDWMPLRLMGQIEDAETGLYYNVNRYYDPKAGKYITPDPLGWMHGEAPYTYANNRPMDGADPLGLFEIPTISFFGIDKLPLKDGGHGDIVRIAFQLYAKEAQEQRFSQAIIDQIVLNNYHTDAASSAFPGGDGGQFVVKNHFDNPNDGAMYLDASMTKYNPNYENINWIQNSIDQININRKKYGLVVSAKNSLGDISAILSSFGQNSHTLADFYAHSNWVDDLNRGGCVKNKRWFSEDEMGYVPMGLNKHTVWDEDISSEALKLLYTGTVSLSPSPALGCVNDISCSADKTTHGYWAKDHDGSPVYAKEKIAEIQESGLNFYGVHEYKSGVRVDQELLEPAQYGIKWWAEDPLTLARKASFSDVKEGDRIYVNQDINNPHRLAQALAIQATLKEIEDLYKKAGTQMIGKFKLTDIFKMNSEEMENASIKFQFFFPKNN